MIECKACKIEKEPTEFYKTKNKTSGLMARCKSCFNKGIFPKPEKKDLELKAIEDEIKTLSSKNANRLDELICKLGSMKLAKGYKAKYDELINACWYKIDKRLGAGNL
jgi:hypothetical protein